MTYLITILQHHGHILSICGIYGINDLESLIGHLRSLIFTPVESSYKTS